MGGHAADQLLAYVTELERLDDEVADLRATKSRKNADPSVDPAEVDRRVGELQSRKSELYREARAVGFDRAALKRLLADRRRRRKGETTASDAQDLYQRVLDMAE